jgi:KaiC/GvpD/RAD55 family RecA-like ATPase
LPEGVSIPLLGQVIGSSVNYGTLLLVEFEPDSLWYETSLTVAAHALRAGLKTDYHAFQRSPTIIREDLVKLGIEVLRLEQEQTLRIIDSYSVQTGLGGSKSDAVQPSPFQSQSVKLSDWNIATSQEIKTGSPEAEKRRLHVDDNTSVLAQYNDEKLLIDSWRTRFFPLARSRELIFLHSMVTGIYSEALLKQFELLCDGIVDFKSEESGGRVNHRFRIRALRGKPCDSRWHGLKLLDNGEVVMED